MDTTLTLYLESLSKDDQKSIKALPVSFQESVLRDQIQQFANAEAATLDSVPDPIMQVLNRYRGKLVATHLGGKNDDRPVGPFTLTAEDAPTAKIIYRSFLHALVTGGGTKEEKSVWGGVETLRAYARDNGCTVRPNEEVESLISTIEQRNPLNLAAPEKKAG